MLKHVLLYTPAKLIPAITGLASLALLTRLLPVGEYGLYALAVTTMIIGQATTGQWLVASLLRLLPATLNDSERAQLLAGLGAWMGIAMIAALLVLFAAYLLIPGIDALVLGITAIIYILFSLQQLVLRVHIADIRSARFSLLQSLQSLVSLGLMAAAVVYIGKTALAALAGVLGGYILLLLADWRTLMPFLRLARAQRAVMMTIWRYGAMLIGVGVFGYLATRLDRFILTHYFGEEAVGYYAAAVNLSEQAIGAMFMIVAMAAQPLAVRAVEGKNDAEMRARLGLNAVWIAGLGFPAAAGFAAVSPELAQVFLGEAYHEAAAALMPIIAYTALMTNLRLHYIDHYFQLGKRNDLLIAALIPSSLLALGVNLWLIPQHGAYGAAYTGAAIQTVSLCVAMYLTRRVMPLYIPWREIAKVTVASTAMLGGILATPAMDSALLSLITKMLVGVVIYLLLIVATNLAGLRQKCANKLKRRA